MSRFPKKAFIRRKSNKFGIIQASTEQYIRLWVETKSSVSGSVSIHRIFSREVFMCALKRHFLECFWPKNFAKPASFSTKKA
jgi:hypothetical protein